ncbi:PREDICTED: serine/threonine-protein kinase/endoribonuclease IRE1-like [Amphimedon queenslandica]|uniref:Protein kinase domain-containing protein n=1 Tax=Amphimedon queenslandica TaxID=400682 RepID=A0AAN0ISK4_AMPQE|nr:PREDICTED: serine/threonine-protein kinase/endoribonuclease IRE1-like [Amphimedon queenslandica]|eukprot:XP_011408729.1 PREDICTED: serine/threonine-protein kinase/endoribonuclease IRE1-like [Amphimedon queenslandica]
MNKFNGLTVVKKDVNQDAVRGLEYLHEQNIVHRDIKPGNILLVQKSPLSEVKAVLADFDLSAKLDDDRSSKTTLNKRGTLSWMAPELLVEDGLELQFSLQSDIFSMGCVIYFAETDGNHPFDTGDSRGAAIHLNVKNYNPCDFHLLNGKPKATALILKMIKRDRASRPSASEVLDDPYFKEDDSQDTIQVLPQLTDGEEAPQVDTPQDTSEVQDGASILLPEESVSEHASHARIHSILLPEESVSAHASHASIPSPGQSVSADGEDYTSIPSPEQSLSADGEDYISIPPEQSVTDTSYSKQLYAVMLNMSHSLPRYIVDHYIRLLANL